MDLIDYLKAEKIPHEKTEKGIIVNGDLYLEFLEVEELPENLTVNGSLFLYDSKIKELPENLRINKRIEIYDYQIGIIPDYLRDKTVIVLFLPKKFPNVNISKEEINIFLNNHKISKSLKDFIVFCDNLKYIGFKEREKTLHVLQKAIAIHENFYK